MSGDSESTGKINGESVRNLPDFLTLSQVSAMLQVSAETLRRAYHRGELPAFLISRSLRIRKADLEGWLTRQRWTPELCAERTARPRNGRRRRKTALAAPVAPAANSGATLAQ